MDLQNGSIKGSNKGGVTMTQDEKGYQGWENYPTWVVKLWLDNDEGTYNHMRELTKDAKEKGKKEPGHVFTETEATLYYLEDAIKNFVEEMTEIKAGMASDLLGWAIGEVNFKEIAEAYLE